MAFTTAIDNIVGVQGSVLVTGDLHMKVIVLDTRQVYGRLELRIAPASSKGGTGSAWINLATFIRGERV